MVCRRRHATPATPSFAALAATQKKIHQTCSMDGQQKWFVSGNYRAKVTVPDYGGRSMQPWVTMVVDSFLLPLNWKL